MIDWEQVGDARIACGDCIQAIGELEPGSVDAVIMDPPYCSGARTSSQMQNRGEMTPGSRWRGVVIDCDQMTHNGLAWMLREVSIAILPKLKPGGSMLCFIDWRSYPIVYGAIESANLRIHALVVWDKRHAALGNGFRNQHELIIHATKGVPTIHDRRYGNVIGHDRLRKFKNHPTEKPVELMRILASVVTGPGDTILDPFMGSATAGAAALLSGRRYVGIELDPKHFEVSRARLAMASNGLHMDRYEPEQSTLFGTGGKDVHTDSGSTETD